MFAHAPPAPAAAAAAAPLCRHLGGARGAQLRRVDQCHPLAALLAVACCLAAATLAHRPYFAAIGKATADGPAAVAAAAASPAAGQGSPRGAVQELRWVLAAAAFSCGCPFNAAAAAAAAPAPAAAGGRHPSGSMQARPLPAPPALQVCGPNMHSAGAAPRRRGEPAGLQPLAQGPPRGDASACKEPVCAGRRVPHRRRRRRRSGGRRAEGRARRRRSQRLCRLGEGGAAGGERSGPPWRACWRAGTFG